MKRIEMFLLFMVLLFPLEGQEFRMTSFVDYYGGIEPSSGYENIRGRIFLQPWFSGNIDVLGLEWVLSANVWVQPLGDPYAVDPWDILGETYLFLPVGMFDFILGQKLVAYGFADVYGPLNTLHSSDRTLLSLDDPYSARRPDPIFQIKYYPTFEDAIELTYVPLTRPDVEKDGPVLLPDSLDQVEWGGDPYILANPHSFFINYSRYGENMDLQLFYGWYTEQTPDFQIAQADSSVPLIISPVYNKKHTFGLAYAIRVWNATLSQDIAFNLTADFAGTDMGAQNSDITVNTQLLWNLPGNILSQWTFVYSFFFNHNQHDPGSDPAAAAYLAEEVQNFHNQPLQHIAFIVAHFERSFLREKLKSQLNVAYTFSPNIYFAPRLAYSITDHWAVEAGADITLGEPPDRDLLRNPSSDNFYLRLVHRL